MTDGGMSRQQCFVNFSIEKIKVNVNPCATCVEQAAYTY